MTAHSPRILTDAETDLLASTPRPKALQSLEEFGLPTRRVEAWHYTDLRANFSKGVKPMAKPANAEQPVQEMLKSEVKFAFFNGYYFADQTSDLPDGLTVAEMDDEALSLPVSVFGDEDRANAVGWINDGFAQSGLTIAVAKDAKIEQPTVITHDFSETGIAANRLSVDLAEGASAVFLEANTCRDDEAVVHSNHVDLTIGKNAHATWIIDQEMGNAATRLARMNVVVGEGAKLSLFVMNAGGKFIRQELDFTVDGEGAELEISGINLIGDKAHIDVTSRITHNVPSTESTEIFRNVVTDAGRGVFQGQIKVAQAAQLTDARMACNTLLLSDDCDFSAKPELEIFADDVQCAHGATVTDLEDQYLFYLKARGIPERDARRLLIRAFVAQVLEDMDDEAIVGILDNRIDAWMSRHV